MSRHALCSLAVFLALAMACAAQSEPTNATVITSQTLDFDYKRSVAIFEGDVVATDPRMKIAADKLTVVFDSTNSVKSIVAAGNVRLWSRDMTATCRQALYLAQDGQVTLRGEATLTRQKDTVSAEKIIIYLNEDRMACEPKEHDKVHMLIYPQEGAHPALPFLPKK
jgi:lipopolysaccharide transport protein LptA